MSDTTYGLYFVHVTDNTFFEIIQYQMYLGQYRAMKNYTKGDFLLA